MLQLYKPRQATLRSTQHIEEPTTPWNECWLCRFSYQLLQGYDFVHMARHHGVRVQVRCAGSVSAHGGASWHLLAGDLLQSRGITCRDTASEIRWLQAQLCLLQMLLQRSRTPAGTCQTMMRASKCMLCCNKGLCACSLGAATSWATF